MAERALEVIAFQDQVNLTKRTEMANSLTSRYPRHIPVILLKKDRNEVAECPKNKFLFSRSHTLSTILYVLRKHLPDRASRSALLLTVSNTIPSTNTPLGKLFDEFKDDDGLLYIVYMQENVYG
mmetsp:Transcript_52249/g.59712  ORF Transcript_52249/g.59712 Transcript_52249/m.59712 type:complete len:124 (-) Transcript_52249:690-1061(-)|eukprot:CAMPEP_0114988460 /NCGR_PEP_ID=MMETSP0216-20121206/9612_1 /TAXON_ID=223996 /ORGANISM="Protocruzia adherens, Strain Boccale" /LENGTH=123 /DNA_ID=CAMNT_0002351245 /DNA_START=325 /DNA_END=696 /DNA_ORIENTATION=-